MCLQPLKIRNPTKKVALNGGQLLKIEVPCGKCAECVDVKRTEWYIRSYYQVQHTLSQGGYILFDTLTYSDEHIPKLSHYIDVNKYGIKDFTCFSHDHFKLFLKRLRRRLQYHYGCNDFKYFLTSEYGTDDRYTHRPHFHILFYITSAIPPLEFSKAISDSWQYGRTDGIAYNSVPYVAKHIYGRNIGYGSNTDFNSVSSVCMYVSKYITKSSKFTARLEKRIKSIAHLFDTYEDYKSMKRNIDMFHRQSQGFGLGFLQMLDARQVDGLHKDELIFPDKQFGVKAYPLPMYYRRKLWYTCKKHRDGRRYWELTDKGNEHVIQRVLTSIDKTTIKYMDIINNSTPNDRSVFYNLLGNRDISEYVIYEKFYRGRLRHEDAVSYYLEHGQHYGLTDTECNLHDWIFNIQYSSINNSLHFGETFLSDDNYIYLIKEWYEDFINVDNPCIYRHMSYDEFARVYTFNEDSCAEFKDFDKITTLIKNMTKQKRENKQKTFDSLELYKERMKQNNLL